MKPGLPALVLLLLSMACAAAQPAPAPEPTAGAWREDLAFLASELRARHKNLHHHLPPETFEASVASLHARIPDLQRHQVIVEMMRIAASIGDGHTNISPLKDDAFRFRQLPVKLYWFEDGIHVRAATPAHAPLVGSRVLAIGGVPIDEALRRVAPLVSRDNDMGLRVFAPIYLAMPGIQQALGLAESPDRSTLTLRHSGKTRDVELPAGDVPAPWPPDTDISLVTPAGWVDAVEGDAPLWLQAPDEYHRIVALPEHSAIYVQINRVDATPARTLEAFGRAVLRRVEQDNPRVLVVDLRLARGGNHDLRFPFVADMVRARDEDTTLYVITGRGSFSATQKLLDDLVDFADAIVVGEPASSRPNSYGDSYKGTLPHSGIAYRVAMLWHQRDQRERDWTSVAIAAPLYYSDYRKGRDPALETALAGATPDDVSARLEAASGEAPAGAMARAVQAYLDDPRNRYADLEQGLVDALVPLIASGDKAAALAAARAAADRFPGSTRLLTLLAYAQARSGQAAEARATALRVLELDPDNRDVRGLLQP